MKNSSTRYWLNLIIRIIAIGIILALIFGYLPVKKVYAQDPTLSIDDQTVTEKNNGSLTMTFTVTLADPPPADTVTVDYATADGTAKAGSDYTITSGTLTFSPGITSQPIDVPILSDTVNEATEIFTVELSNASPNATIADPIGIGTILDNDPPPTLSINDASITEGDSGTSLMNFTVTLSGPTEQTVTVAYTTVNSSAIAGSDYTTTSGTLTFTPPTSTQTISVPIVGDTVNEPTETFTVVLSSPVPAITITKAIGTGTILDNDPPPTLSINDASITEGDSGTSLMNFTVTLTGATSQVVTVAYATANGSALAGSDYTTTSGTLTFTPPTSTQTISVPIVGDLVNEPTETFTVVLSSPVPAITITKAIGTGTIYDNDPPSLSINDASITEGNSTLQMNFTVTLTGVTSQVVTVAYATANGSAIAGSDYTTTSGILTFTPPTSAQTISVPILGDLMNEPTETFTVVLSGPVNAIITKSTGTGTINNDDPLPTLSIDNQSILEGNSGTTLMSFTVTLTGATAQVVTVAYGTVDGTATSPSDYTAKSGTLTFNPGQPTTQIISVSILGDPLNEPNETFTVVLSSPGNATITKATGTGTIINDDGSPTLFINNKSITEGDTGTSLMNFTVILAGSTTQVVTVAYATVDGSATAPFDYSATSGTLTFTPPSSTQTISVPIVGDLVNEPTETFIVRLSNPTNATIADGDGIGTILDNDLLPTLSINDQSITEGNSGTSLMSFTVTLSGVYGQTVTVAYTTVNGTATAPSDFNAISNTTLTFLPGETSKTISVDIVGDTFNESNETFIVRLSSPTNATIVKADGIGTIINDDGSPALSINDISQTEGNGGTTNFNFTVTLSPASNNVVTVNYSTYDGTAIAGSDYIATSGILSFSPGVVTKTITVPVIGDYIKEPNDTFSVRLTEAVNAAILVDTGFGTIIDDDLFRTMLPMLSNPAQPDLIASAFTLTPSGPSYHSTTRVTITVQVKNAGSADAGPFWVDFYINPQPPPTGSNIPWNTVCGMDPCYGIAWYVTNGLKPGQSITLTSTAGSYDSNYTIWPGMFLVGTSDLYVYVDSWGGPNGAVDEINESNNRGEIHGLKVTP